jgi:hypothetical protein
VSLARARTSLAECAGGAGGRHRLLGATTEPATTSALTFSVAVHQYPAGSEVQLSHEVSPGIGFALLQYWRPPEHWHVTEPFSVTEYDVKLLALGQQYVAEGRRLPVLVRN